MISLVWGIMDYFNHFILFIFYGVAGILALMAAVLLIYAAGVYAFKLAKCLTQS